MSAMRKVSTQDFKYYLEKDRVLYRQKCSGKSCPYGLTNDGKWPKKEACGEKQQAYWCKFACDGECTTFIAQNVDKKIQTRRNLSVEGQEDQDDVIDLVCSITFICLVTYKLLIFRKN